MSQSKLIKIEILCLHYAVEDTFFQQLDEIGLIEILQVENTSCVNEQQIAVVDKMVRLHRDLEINPPGLDVVFNLLKKIELLEQRLLATQNKLSIYE